MAVPLLLLCLQAAAEEVVVVGGEDGYRPYETLDNRGRPVGFNIDLMRAIAEAGDFEVRFELGEWDEMRDALATGRIDVLGMFVSPRRENTVDFARPHVIVHHRIFIPSGGTPIARIEDLEGRQVIVQRRAYSHEYLLQHHPDIELTLVDSDTEGLELLAGGEHDAALLTEHRGRYTLERQNIENLAVSGPPVLPVEYALAVKQGNDELLDRLNEGLDQVMSSGEFDRIYARWLRPFEEEEQATSRTVMVTLIIVALLAALALVWLSRRLLVYRREIHAARQQLAYLREHDTLTGLLSRHALERRIDELCRNPGSGEHSLLNINVDQFRLVNERLGHAQADKLLQRLAHRLKALLPIHAEIARLGADEFAVLLTDTDQESARESGHEMISDLASRPLSDGDDHQSVTLSIGLVTFSDGEDSIERILRRADCACVAAKEDGGNQIHAWHPEDQRLAEKYGELGWVHRIQSALNEGRMLLYWQSIVPTSEPPYRTNSIEILIRMQSEDPDEATITAAQFMPAAERYFMTAQIDRWVVSSVLGWMENNPAVVEMLERVNINLSGRSLGDARFLNFLDRRTREHARLLPKLCIEVTETALISNIEAARELLERLHRSGCRIALDDFGTGVSSMNYLRQLPVDYLKIDGSFVHGIDRDPEAFEFISEVNRLGHAMGKITVAECVESESLAQCLMRADVDYMQGYLIDYPQPLDDLESHLSSQRSTASKRS
ncbi:MULTISPECIES: bifunctional diguanylate cyclase/phosphodiesterase [unclassified Wenzhouxiangella]|uniref:putative bifunctional diguanylate cyclase/phosphodiesterase n=1 Tax=unclassified Wenzhouxiangella TaxID=2613841 RepID=UPI000E328EF0|nr:MULTISPECIES: EAL domain-containing protein [unclassified Wenzhouxiangella]RFF26868.1 EAL domain-containing protein [Wenzhouxiangella sp. 15181]RFP68478.1 EAL domain-containing protein [Wenzhouxiangella sp. 15190]